LIANLFMHYAFDAWIAREFPGVRFERYCDDVVVHCASEQQARQVRDAIAGRLAEVGLELHPGKTRIVYCKDDDRRDDHEVTSFVFLGYQFRPRLAKNKYGKHFVSFLPAVSPEAIKAERTRSRASETALSGRPTMVKAGMPGATCTCTSTGRTSMPSKATVATRSTMFA